MEMSIKVRGMRLFNNLPTLLIEGKLKLGRKCFVQAKKKALYEFTTTVVLNRCICVSFVDTKSRLTYSRFIACPEKVQPIRMLPLHRMTPLRHQSLDCLF